MRWQLYALTAWLLAGPVSAGALTLDEAMAAAGAPHPQRRLAEADLALARADVALADSATDFMVSLDAGLRSGRPTAGPDDWRADNTARLLLRKPLADFGRSENTLAAAREGVASRELALLDAVEARRIAIMARFFDVLLADMRYAADNEYMAVAFVNLDDARKRFALGELTPAQLGELDARYQDLRERRNRSLDAVRNSRLRLATAINRDNDVPRDLQPPVLADNGSPLPDYEALLPLALAGNRTLLAIGRQLEASRLRMAAIRADRGPRLDVEAETGAYSRDSTNRDAIKAGVVLNWPIHAGTTIDARLAREAAQRERLLAERDAARIAIRETLLDVWQEAVWLRDSALPAARAQTRYRDTVLERARAEYELELKSNLGNAMADTQTASLRLRDVEYRLALARVRLQALLGNPLPPESSSPVP
jgi:outer membrane protein TolC